MTIGTKKNWKNWSFKNVSYIYNVPKMHMNIGKEGFLHKVVVSLLKNELNLVFSA